MVSGQAHASAPYRGTGSMIYPEGDLEYIWDGRGMTGAAAICEITEGTLRLSPRKGFRATLGWPEFTLDLATVDKVEELFKRNYRFRTADQATDGVCFHPIGSRENFRAALEQRGLKIVRLSWRERVRSERHLMWNQMRWGGRRRQSGSVVSRWPG